MWRGWWNDCDCVVGLYNDVGLRQNCRGGKRKLLWQFTVVIMCDPVELKENKTHMDSHQHHFEERAVFVGCGVRAVEVNVVSECERKVNL